jgi:hypothetical protein
MSSSGSCFHAKLGSKSMADTELEQMAREVVSVYEGVTITGDWPQLSIPIVALRAALWRIDGVTPPLDEAPRPTPRHGLRWYTESQDEEWWGDA